MAPLLGLMPHLTALVFGAARWVRGSRVHARVCVVWPCTPTTRLFGCARGDAAADGSADDDAEGVAPRNPPRMRF